MHIVFVHFHFLRDNHDQFIYNDLKDKNINVSIVQRSNKFHMINNQHFIKDEFESELRWWQNSEIVSEHIAKLNPDIVYVFGLNLPLHFRWLKHHLRTETIIIGQHCGENLWIQRNLWLQQSALRIVDGFVFDSQENANKWLKCAAILDSQPVFNIDQFKNEAIIIQKQLLYSSINRQ